MTPTDLMSRILIHAHMNDVTSVSAHEFDYGQFEVRISGTPAQAEALECDLRGVLPVTTVVRVVAVKETKRGALPLSPAAYYSARYPVRLVDVAARELGAKVRAGMI